MNTVIQQGHITVYWLKETAKVFIVLQTLILDIAVPSNFVFNKVSWKSSFHKNSSTAVFQHWLSYAPKAIFEHQTEY